MAHGRSATAEEQQRRDLEPRTRNDAGLAHLIRHSHIGRISPLEARFLGALPAHLVGRIFGHLVAAGNSAALAGYRRGKAEAER